MKESKTGLGFSFSKPAIYKIIVQGELQNEWPDRLGLQISVEKKEYKKTVTIMIGRIADQAALSGILVKLNDLHLTVISVNMLTDVDDNNQL
jgi:hypothetical protein